MSEPDDWQQQVLRDLRRGGPAGGASSRPERPPARAAAPPARPAPVSTSALTPVDVAPARPNVRTATTVRSHSRRVAPVPRATRIRRALAVAAGSATASQRTRESLDVHSQLTAAVPSGRRIVVIGLQPGVGSTTAAALVTMAVSSRRSEPILVVDAARTGAHPTLATRFDATPGRTLTDLARDRPAIDSRADLAAHLTPVGRDVWLLPGRHGIPTVPGAEPGPGPDGATYRAAVSGLSRFFDIVVTDLGANADIDAGTELITGAHALCVVCDGTREGITWAESLIRRLRDAGPQSWAGRIVILANTRGAASKPTRAVRRAVGTAMRRARRARVPIVLLPHDPTLRRPLPSATDRLEHTTSRSALRLAAALLDTAVPELDDHDVHMGQAP